MANGISCCSDLIDQQPRSFRWRPLLFSMLLKPLIPTTERVTQIAACVKQWLLQMQLQALRLMCLWEPINLRLMEPRKSDSAKVREPEILMSQETTPRSQELVRRLRSFSR